MTRNLIYFITPKGNWQWNLALLNKYAAVFTGKKYAVLAAGKELVPSKEAELSITTNYPALFDELWTIPNSLALRETPGLYKLLELIQNEPGVTFFGHTKGVTQNDNEAVERWAQACYDKNLADMPTIDLLLSKFASVGCFRRKGKWAHLKPVYKWHYSGTFWWLNNSKLVSGEWTKALREHKYGAEEFIGNLIPYDQSYCLFGDNCGDLYNLNYIKRLLGVK